MKEGAYWPSITLLLFPTKNDRTGKKKLSRLFILDEEAESLCTARALRKVLQGETTVGDLQMVPLLKDPKHGGELSNRDSAKAFAQFLEQAGFAEMATELHSPRAGSAKAHANSEKGASLLPVR